MRPAVLLDESHLLPLTGGDAAFRREVLDCFLDSARSNIGALTVIETLPAWQEALHRLKGLALSVGATALAEIVADAESSVPDPQRVRHITAAFDMLVRHIGNQDEF
jgi:HPt (histidine-containing phosphotransfer) domain-containing protein